ncbi:SDR family NAD(P)-dependent oxidoreductase [Pseudactinotalea sp.]|uniref:SDR family NAD(P)-dependent oxidoreductase n=1 Tax=Pseudactinotalea sp. TaxID=1926260 RepID=UPI003B3A396B
MRKILVTGGSRGIGYAIADAFIGDGADVTITGRDGDRLTAAGARLGARTVLADGTDTDAVEALAAHFHDGVDVIVNNAGGFTGAPPAAAAPLATHADHWTAGLRANLLSAVLTVTALDDVLRGGGSVISIGSIGAEYAANPYSTAKAALAAWNAGLSASLGARDITANVVAPGFIDGTDLFGGGMTAERRAALIERTHVKRVGQVADVAALVHFLASDRARHITGQTLHVNGGAHTTR